MWEHLPKAPWFQRFMQTPEFLELPAMTPPPGVTPNFVNPSNLRQPELAALQLSLVTIVTGIRLYMKTLVVKKTLPEDYWLYVSWISFAGFHVIVFMLEDLPLGVHQYDIKIRQALVHAKLYFIAIGLYAIIMMAIKIAIILQIRRVFFPRHYNTVSPLYQKLRWVIDILLGMNILYYLSMFIFHWCVCTPIQRSWDPRVPGKCIPNDAINYIVSGVINTISDLIIVVAPQPVIWNLTMNKQKKWGLSFVFGLGVLALGASIARLFYSIELWLTEDNTYYAALMAKWGEPELTLGFLAACLPIMPRFIKHLTTTTVGTKVTSICSAVASKATHRIARNPSGQIETIGSRGRGEQQPRLNASTKELTVISQDESYKDLDLMSKISGRKTLSEDELPIWEDIEARPAIQAPPQAAPKKSAYIPINPF